MQITLNAPDNLSLPLIQQYIKMMEAQLSLLGKVAKNNQSIAKRTVGEYQKKIRISDDFDEPLPDEFWLGE